MITEIAFTVFGVPQPQGSTRAFMRKGARFPIVTSDNPKLKGWRQLVAEGASRALAGGRGVQFDGPVKISASFFLARPKSLKGKVAPHLTRPDTDKLLRGLGDALSGVLYRDDSQVVHVDVTKAYAGPDESPRVVVSVAELLGQTTGEPAKGGTQ